MVRDRYLAFNLTQMVNDVSPADSSPKLYVSIIQATIKSEFWPSAIQTRTVYCSWLNPKRSAWLKFKNMFRAQKARSYLCRLGLRIDRRELRSTMESHEAGPKNPDTINRKIWVHLTNLSVNTTRQTIEQYISGSCPLLNFKSEDPLYIASTVPASAVEGCIKRGFAEI